jgi:hypothetical protein
MGVEPEGKKRRNNIGFYVKNEVNVEHNILINYQVY